MFGNTKDLPGPGGRCDFTAEEDAISRYMVGVWRAMADGGNPNGGGGATGTVVWPRYDLKQSLGVVFNQSAVVAESDYSVCKFWDRVDGIVYGAAVKANGGNASVAGSGPAGTGSGGPAPSTTGASSANGGAAGLSGQLGVAIAVVMVIGFVVLV